MNITPATIDQIDEIVFHLAKNFVEFDPLTHHLSINAIEFSTYLLPYVKASIDMQLTLIATDSHGLFAGAIVTLAYNYPLHYRKKSLNIQNYHDFFMSLRDSIPSQAHHDFSLKNPAVILEGGYLTVTPNHYGTDLPARLQAALFELAKKNHYQYILSEFTNPCNYSLYKRQFRDSFNVLSRLRYCDFINSSGIKPMHDAAGECILAAMDITRAGF